MRKFTFALAFIFVVSSSRTKAQDLPANPEVALPEMSVADILLSSIERTEVSCPAFMIAQGWALGWGTCLSKMVDMFHLSMDISYGYRLSLAVDSAKGRRFFDVEAVIWHPKMFKTYEQLGIPYQVDHNIVLIRLKDSPPISPSKLFTVQAIDAETEFSLIGFEKLESKSTKQLPITNIQVFDRYVSYQNIDGSCAGKREALVDASKLSVLGENDPVPLLGIWSAYTSEEKTTCVAARLDIYQEWMNPIMAAGADWKKALLRTSTTVLRTAMSPFDGEVLRYEVIH